MKVIKKDNFDREHVSDVLICETKSDYWTVNIAKLLEEKYGGEQSTNLFVAVNDDYKLYSFEP